jgi:hypothetical protein
MASTLTPARLKQIIKEELDALMAEMEAETDPEVAALEATIAEAKKKIAAKKAKKMGGKDPNQVPAGFGSKGVKKGMAKAKK